MMTDETDPFGLASSASGILECLRMLADEAAELQLDDTLRALRAAIAVCQSEHGKISHANGEMEIAIPADALLH